VALLEKRDLVQVFKHALAENLIGTFALEWERQHVEAMYHVNSGQRCVIEIDPPVQGVCAVPQHDLTRLHTLIRTEGDAESRLDVVIAGLHLWLVAGRY
jgi:hypothetical protein